MNRRTTLLLLALVLPASQLEAQAETMAPASEAVGTVRDIWRQLTSWITTAAEEAPDSVLAFRPTPEVRTFGEIVAHVAGAQHMICGAALNEEGGPEDQIEQQKLSKAELVAALKKSTEHCERAYAQTDAAARGKTRLFGGERTRLSALTLNATHNGEHYGNLVTYMRINGIVPPSSRQQ